MAVSQHHRTDFCQNRQSLLHYHRLLRDGTCAVNYGKHTPFQKGRGHLCLSIGSQFSFLPPLDPPSCCSYGSQSSYWIL